MPTALVTGGNRGIGRAIVVALAGRGFHVAFVDLEENENTERTLAAVEEGGEQATFIRDDIADLQCHERVARRAWEIDGRLDTLVNNAGIPAPVRGDLLDVAPAAFDRVIAVNLRGTTFRGTDAKEFPIP